MPGLRDTLARLTALRRELGQALGEDAPTVLASASVDAKSLTEIADFGSNPGRLRMKLHVPVNLPTNPALLVALHGCTQSAETYDAGSGWVQLADRHGFVVLFPEQPRGNNPNRCFNWFVPANTHRDSGEAMSIRQMIARTAAAHSIDAKRIFVTGLSAGGALTSSLLATYPEVFAAGAIVAGLPHGSASSLSEAMQAMLQGRTNSAQHWGEIARGASSHHGPWPRVAIWHGGSDHVVRTTNAEASVLQWTNVHGLPEAPNSDVTGGAHRVRTWLDRNGRSVVEAHIIAGMGHGVALSSGAEHSAGIAGPFHFDVGIPSSTGILAFFGLTTDKPARRAEAAPYHGTVDAKEGVHGVLRQAGVLNDTMTGRRRKPPLGADVHRVINRALRSAGLIKKED